RGGMAQDFPAILGFDVSGTVERTESPEFADGDEVFGRSSSGSYAQYTVSEAGSLARKPDGVSQEQAGALPVAGETAWQALFDHGGLESGQTVLVNGAA